MMAVSLSGRASAHHARSAPRACQLFGPLMLSTALLGPGAWTSRAVAEALPVSVGVVSVVNASRPAHRDRTKRPRVRPESLRAKHARVAPFIVEAAALYGLPPALLRAVIRVESNYEPTARSSKGAMGLMQLMPATAASMGVNDAWDPRENILGGARYLRELIERWGGDLVRVAASYNAGPGAVEKYGGVPPYAETRGYVKRILKHYRAYASRRILLRR